MKIIHLKYKKDTGQNVISLDENVEESSSNIRRHNDYVAWLEDELTKSINGK